MTYFLHFFLTIPGILTAAKWITKQNKLPCLARKILCPSSFFVNLSAVTWSIAATTEANLTKIIWLFFSIHLLNPINALLFISLVSAYWRRHWNEIYLYINYISLFCNNCIFQGALSLDKLSPTILQKFYLSRCIVICVSFIENFTTKICLALLPFIWLAGE